MKKLIKLLLLLIVGIAFIGGILGLYFYRDYKKAIENPFNQDEEVLNFIIEDGQSLNIIAENLQEEGLIKNTLYFKLYLKQAGIETKVQAGKFNIPKNSSIKQIAEILQNAQKFDVWVTIPEGLMAKEIALKLEEAFNTNPENSFNKENFMILVENGALVNELGIPKPADKPLEGYLYPDTYRFPADATEEYVLNAMLTEGLLNKIYNKYKSEIESSQFSFYEILTLASLLERETRHPDDRPLVADILIRRINDGWRLDIDATLLYYFGDWKHEITYQDLQLDTQYNTRKLWGYPPTPIANPGENCIRAILYPEPNNYWYYINDAQGILHYATTEYEQTLNIQKYIYNR